MKSLAALLDRKKRANTLVPASLPPSSPFAPTSQEKLAPPLYTSKHVASSDLLRPPLARHRATSNPNLPRNPHLYEPHTYTHPRIQSPVQSLVYHNDSDDDTLADPFAASSPIKARSTLPPTSFRPLPTYTPARRGSSPNLADDTAPQDVFQSQKPVRNTQAERNSIVAPRIVSQTPSPTGANSNESVSAPIIDITGKGRRLRERRSLSNLFRSQASSLPDWRLYIAAVSTGPAPQLPPFPTRVPERKSSFFKRARSGSTPATTQGSEWAHTSRRLSAAPASVPAQSQMVPAPQLRSANRGSARPTPETPSTLGSATPGSWVRVGGVSYDQGSPISPTNARRRALSVPAKPPRPTELAPPVPLPHFVPSASSGKPDAFEVTPEEILPIPRPEVPSDRQVRPTRSAHGLRSASVSVSDSHDAGCGPFESNIRRRPSLRYFKQSSASASEGGHGSDSTTSADRAVRKSALKRSSAQTRQVPHSYPDSRVAVAISTTSISHTSAAHQGVSDHRSKAGVAGHRRPMGRIILTTSSTNNSPIDSPRTPPSAGSASSIGNILRGHGLAPSDSRALPVLDNIWGSFVSETAFGSLPPSPSDSVLAKNRAINPQKFISRRQTIECTSGPETPRSLPRRRWNLGLPPPSSPPIVELPPTPKDQSPAMALPLGSVERRKLSRSPSKREMLLTPPISPTEEVEIPALGVVLSASNSNSSLMASSYNGSSVSSISSRDPPSRLIRSASSPVIRPLESPISDRSNRSWLSINPPRLGSDSLLSTSQCTSVPRSPIGSPFSATNLGLSCLGTSSGTSTSTLSISCSEGGHVENPNEVEQDDDLQLRCVSPPCVPIEDSEISLSMFPTVPLGISKPSRRREVDRSAVRGENLPASWSEESLLTPPITPAWFAQVFDASSENGREGSKPGETGDEIALAQLGSFARIRRRNHVQKASSSSNEDSLDGIPVSDIPLPLSRRNDWRSGDAIVYEKRMGQRF
ncbi:hypothetical protein FRC07_000454 [Ceratobasidium sp. 392]|nr:hypothetical protein FRC07_000454 [Ceratobasidium sp. 392]